MNRKIVIALAVTMIVGVILLGVAAAYNPAQSITAETKVTRHVFRGVGDVEVPWQYIYIMNPTWQTIDVKGVQLNTSVNGVFHPELSWWLTPDNFPTSPNNGWDTQVLPFEKSVILWHGWIVGETEPEGTYHFDITVSATVMGQDIELKTRSEFVVSL
jgi:hypothetical protein